MTSEYIRPLIVSFPWLTESEASTVAAALPLSDPTASAADHMVDLATSLEKAGLPPTSTLLLSLAGRGSKGTAVKISRGVARARFERPISALPGYSGVLCGAEPAPSAGRLDETQLRKIIQVTVEEALGKMPGAFGGSGGDRLVSLIESVAGEVRWLKSTIDTERQLRRYREAHGPLPEHQAPQGPATTAERRTVVHRLAASLEHDRFSAHVSTPIDQADGRNE